MQIKVKHTIIFFISIIMSIVFMTTHAMAGTSKAIDPSRYNTIDGVLSIKEGHGHVVIRIESGKTKTLRVRDDSRITRNGSPALYSDLRRGDTIRAIFNNDKIIIELHAEGT